MDGRRQEVGGGKRQVAGGRWKRVGYRGPKGVMLVSRRLVMCPIRIVFRMTVCEEQGETSGVGSGCSRLAIVSECGSVMTWSEYGHAAAVGAHCMHGGTVQVSVRIQRTTQHTRREVCVTGASMYNKQQGAHGHATTLGKVVHSGCKHSVHARRNPSVTVPHAPSPPSITASRRECTLSPLPVQCRALRHNVGCCGRLVFPRQAELAPPHGVLAFAS